MGSIPRSLATGLEAPEGAGPWDQQGRRLPVLRATSTYSRGQAV